MTIRADLIQAFVRHHVHEDENGLFLIMLNLADAARYRKDWLRDMDDALVDAPDMALDQLAEFARLFLEVTNLHMKTRKAIIAARGQGDVQ